MDTIYTTLQMNDITDQYDPAEIEEQKALSIICIILFVLFFLPAISYKTSAYAKNLSNQLLTIFLAFFVNSFIIGRIPFLGGFISSIISIVLLALVVLKVIDAANGKLRELPFGFSIPAFK